MPLASVTGIDHVVILVRDLDAARDRFRRLGFTVSPRGRHSEHMGTVNHTIMLDEDYIELLGIERATDANAGWREALSRREGLETIVLRTTGAAATAAELRAAGVAAADPVHFSRPVAPRKAAAFNVCFFPPEATPQLSMFACEHLTRDLVWLPELTEHRNASVGLAAVSVASDNLSGLPQAYGRLFGMNRVVRNGPELTVETGSAPIRFLTREGLAGRYPGVDPGTTTPPYVAALTIRVRDIDAAAGALAGLEVVEAGKSLCIGPREACGVLLELTE